MPVSCHKSHDELAVRRAQIGNANWHEAGISCSLGRNLQVVKQSLRERSARGYKLETNKRLARRTRLPSESKAVPGNSQAERQKCIRIFSVCFWATKNDFEAFAIARALTVCKSCTFDSKVAHWSFTVARRLEKTL